MNILINDAGRSIAFGKERIMKFDDKDKIADLILNVAQRKYEIIIGDKYFDDIVSDRIFVLQIKRKNLQCRIKTLLFADLSEVDIHKDWKKDLKDIMLSTAMVKEALFDTENIDLYLFLALPDKIDREECVRIEATEQLCRKYVLMPDERLSDFFERTFLYQVASEQSVIHGLEPIFNALSKTGMNYNWMSQDIQREWRTFFWNIQVWN